MTFAMPFGLIGMAARLAVGSRLRGFGLLALAGLNRIIQCLAVGWGVVRDSHSRRFCWLYPVRDLLGFFLCYASFLGAEIIWRGERYELQAGGKVMRKIVQSQAMLLTI